MSLPLHKYRAAVHRMPELLGRKQHNVCAAFTAGQQAAGHDCLEDQAQQRLRFAPAAGDDHTLLLTSAGDLWSCGTYRTSSAVLGHSTTARNARLFQRVYEAAATSDPVVQIASGELLGVCCMRARLLAALLRSSKQYAGGAPVRDWSREQCCLS